METYGDLVSRCLCCRNAVKKIRIYEVISLDLTRNCSGLPCKVLKGFREEHFDQGIFKAQTNR
jgi:hypothetical protein